MIIKVYGEYWSKNRVDWRARRLVGKRKGKKPCDAWNQRGIYALYKDFRVVYVGLADSRGIGKRLKDHLTDRFAERWDSFSFFGICDLDEHGNARPPKPLTVDPTSVIKSLELAAILLSNPPLNRAQGKFPGSERVWQVEPDQPTDRHRVQARLDRLVNEIQHLQQSLSAKRRKPGRHADQLTHAGTNSRQRRS